MSNPLRLAFIGCGGFARRYHLPVLRDNPAVRVTLICDPSKAPELAHWAAALGAKQTSDTDDLWQPGACDAVIVSTPHTMHADHTRLVLQHDKDVMVDKPFVMHDSDAESLAELAVQRGVTNAVGFNRRLDPAFVRARALIQQGHIGRVRHVDTVQLGYEREGWFLVQSLGGGGPFTGRASHMADIVPWLTGKRPESVRARVRPGEAGRSDYGGFIDLRFTDMDCRMTCIEAGFHMWDELRLYGDDGMIELRRPLTMPIGWSLTWTKNRAGDFEFMTADPTPGAVTLDFVDAVRNGTAPSCSFAEARTSVRVVESAFRSGREGEQWLPL
jgi:predicted dehydrogenase